MEQIKVLIVDDSAFIRSTLASLINSDPAFKVVGMAVNGKEGVEMAEALKPDIVTMDINMPVMDGLEALPHIRRKTSAKVVMISSLTTEGAHATFEALSKGAVDFIPKEKGDSPYTVLRVKESLLEKLKAIGKKTRPLVPVPQEPPRASAPARIFLPVNVLAIGTSTGGPKALQELLPQFPEKFGACGVIVQHMPPEFIGPFAERLDRICKITVKLGEEGEPLSPGTFLFAPGNHHMKLRRERKHPATVHLDPEPSGSLHRPSVDQTFFSVAHTYPGDALGVIMTGMGHDGLEGVREMKHTNCVIYAQDEDSCVVYGMPKAVVDEKLADRVIPLSEMYTHISKVVR